MKAESIEKYFGSLRRINSRGGKRNIHCNQPAVFQRSDLSIEAWFRQRRLIVTPRKDAGTPACEFIEMLNFILFAVCPLITAELHLRGSRIAASDHDLKRIIIKEYSAFLLLSVFT